MPYIDTNAKQRVDLTGQADRIGELTYLLTKTCLEYTNNNDPSYALYNAVIGSLECTKLELYRRLISKYEDQKIEENGDVF